MKKSTSFLGICLLAIVFGGASNGIIAGLSTQIEKELQISHTIYGSLFSASSIGGLAASLAIWRMISRTGYKRMGLLGLACMAAGNGFISTALMPLMLVGRFLTGMSMTCIFLTASGIIVYGFPDQRKALLNLLQGIIVVGSGSGLFLAVPFTQWVGRWQLAPLSLSIIGLVVFILMALLSCQVTPGGETSREGGFREALQNPSLQAALFGTVAYIFAETAFFSFFPAFAELEKGYDRLMATRMGSIFLAGIIVGRFFMVGWRPKLREDHLIILTICVGAVSLLVALWINQPYLAALAVFVGGFSAGPIPPLAANFSVGRIRYGKDKVLALNNIGMCAGGLFGSFAIGALADHTSLQFSMTIATVLFLLSFAFFTHPHPEPAV